MNATRRAEGWLGEEFGSSPVDSALRLLLDPGRRSALLFPWDPSLRLAALWPEDPGFSARFESAARPGVPALWIRWRDRFETWPFPRDPELCSMPDLVDRGYEVLGHRLGRRATLLSPEGSVLHLRGPGASKKFERWRAVHESLDAAGARVPRLGPVEPSFGGLEAEWIQGDGAPVTNPEAWRSLGSSLAAAHAASPPPGLPRRESDAAIGSMVRQVGFVARSGRAFAGWLARQVEGMGLLAEAREGSRSSLVHGDLHPAQVIWSTPPAIIDWERAGVGEPEEDLGNLAAHLYWEQGAAVRTRFAALRAGYLDAGGSADPGRFAFHASVSLLRVLAVHCLREPPRTRLLDVPRWAEWPAVAGGWWPARP